tara:strand:- start:946 stop:1602 length:657 start_codon:yes stop_codon:yes gene_type:complete
MDNKRPFGSYDNIFRLVLVGNSNVGKTALTRKFSNKQFTENYDATIGIDYGSTIIKISNSKLIKCQIWDTAGQEVYAPLIASYYKDTSGFIIVFDVSSRKSFNKVKYWLQEIEKHKNHNINVPKILVGNKIDKYGQRNVTKVEAIDFAHKHKLLYQETSVIQNKNVDKILLMLCDEIYNQIDSLPGIKYGSNRIELNDGVQNNIDVDPDKFTCNCSIN